MKYFVILSDNTEHEYNATKGQTEQKAFIAAEKQANKKGRTIVIFKPIIEEK